MSLRMDVTYDGDAPKLRRFVGASRLATRATGQEIGNAVLALARKKAPRFTGNLALNSESRTVVALNGYTTTVEFNEAYALYQEMGFRGHFVPFHLAPSLYTEAISRWGWQIAGPGTVKNPRPGAIYLIPPGRGRPRWGVFVRGDAHPFLRPSLREVWDSGYWLDIARREFQSRYRLIRSNG